MNKLAYIFCAGFLDELEKLGSIQMKRKFKIKKTMGPEIPKERQVRPKPSYGPMQEKRAKACKVPPQYLSKKPMKKKASSIMAKIEAAKKDPSTKKNPKDTGPKGSGTKDPRFKEMKFGKAAVEAICGR